MIDITKIQLNPIPPSIIELQTAQTTLQENNNILRNILIVGGVLTLLYFGDKIIAYFQEETELIDKKSYPRILTKQQGHKR
jgi:hypothetical protein